MVNEGAILKYHITCIFTSRKEDHCCDLPNNSTDRRPQDQRHDDDVVIMMLVVILTYNLNTLLTAELVIFHL